MLILFRKMTVLMRGVFVFVAIEFQPLENPRQGNYWLRAITSLSSLSLAAYLFKN
jgi:hypothetical protein